MHAVLAALRTFDLNVVVTKTKIIKYNFDNFFGIFILKDAAIFGTAQEPQPGHNGQRVLAQIMRWNFAGFECIYITINYLFAKTANFNGHFLSN